MADLGGRALAAMLEIYRAAREYSLTELAEDFSVPKSTMCRWMLDRRVISKVYRGRLALEVAAKLNSLVILEMPWWVTRGERDIVIKTLAESLQNHYKNWFKGDSTVFPGETESITMNDIFATILGEVSTPKGAK